MDCFWITAGEASSPSGPWIHADGSTDVLWEQAVAAGTIWPSDWLRPPTEFMPLLGLLIAKAVCYGLMHPFQNSCVQT